MSCRVTEERSIASRVADPVIESLYEVVEYSEHDPGERVYFDRTDPPEPGNRVEAHICKRCGVIYVEPTR